MERAGGLPDAQRLDLERQQRELAGRVIAQDDAECLVGPGGWQDGLHIVAGLDISFPPDVGSGGAFGIRPPVWAQEGAAAIERPDTSEPVAADKSDPSAGAACPVAALAVLDFPALQLHHLELLLLVGEHALRAPYQPGFLAFREVPAYLELLRRAAAKGVHPQLLLVDGFGVLHPRRCGSASHVGVLTGLPTVGVAKHLLQLEGLLAERQVRATATAASSEAPHPCEGEAAGPCAGSSMEAGSCGKWQPLASSADEVVSRAAGSGSALWMPLADSTGDVLGAALCCPQAGQAASGRCNSRDSRPLSSSGSRPRGGSFLRPIYVSAGHRVSLATALAVVARCCKHRVPEPIRQADLLSRAEVRRRLQQGIVRQWQQGSSQP